jgi:hypothetical protein
MEHVPDNVLIAGKFIVAALLMLCAVAWAHWMEMRASARKRRPPKL